jgi:hypothetical protein
MVASSLLLPVGKMCGEQLDKFHRFGGGLKNLLITFQTSINSFPITFLQTVKDKGGDTFLEDEDFLSRGGGGVTLPGHHRSKINEGPGTVGRILCKKKKRQTGLPNEVR